MEDICRVYSVPLGCPRGLSLWSLPVVSFLILPPRMLACPAPRGYHPNQAHLLGQNQKPVMNVPFPHANTFPKPPFLEPRKRAGPLYSLTEALAEWQDHSTGWYQRLHPPLHPRYPEGQPHAWLWHPSFSLTVHFLFVSPGTEDIESPRGLNLETLPSLA